MRGGEKAGMKRKGKERKDHGKENEKGRVHCAGHHLLASPESLRVASWG
jgi:hypothetical protein